MAKRAAETTLSPFRLSMGNGIYLEDAIEVVEMQNQAYGHSSAPHLSITSAPAGWGSTGSEESVHNALFPSALASDLLYQFVTWVDADTVTIAIEAGATVASGHSCKVHFDIGAASTEILTFSAGTSTQAATIATSSTGAGFIQVKITLQHVSGAASTANQLNSILIEDQPQTTSADASSIRDPEL